MQSKRKFQETIKILTEPRATTSSKDEMIEAEMTGTKVTENMITAIITRKINITRETGKIE
jgi:hypothetical protein